MKLILGILFLVLFINSCSHLAKEKNIEFNSNDYWENFVAHSNEDNFSILNSIQNKSPALYQQIKSDSEDKALLVCWGQSINFDSGAKATILDHKLIAELQSKFGIKNDNHFVHAGIMHTYGYLFSSLITPYGFKRTRWTKPTLNKGFGLNNLSLSPFAIEGTLLSNITYFAGKLAFKNIENIKNLDKLSHVSNEIKNYNYQSLNRIVLDENIKSPKNIQKILRSTLVKFITKPNGEENDYLLIYSFEDLKNREEKLITAFPIKTDAYLKIVDAMALGTDRPIIVRYNAYIGTTQDDRLSGKRLILKNY